MDVECAGPDAPSSARGVRDWLVDSTMFGLALALGPLLNAGVFTGDVSWTWPAAGEFAVGVLACLLLWWRRRWPVVTTLVIIGLGVVADSADMVSGPALFSLAVHRGGPVVVPVAMVDLLTELPAAFGYPDPRYPVWFAPVLISCSVAAIVAWGMWVRARRQLVASLAERARRAEAEQELRVDQARRAERARIAREMHDALGHEISMVAMHAGALEFRLDAPVEDRARAAMVIRTSAHRALEELRGVLAVLRAEELPEEVDPPQPGIADLDELVASMRATGTEVTTDIEIEGEVPTVMGRNAYRIVREALTNAGKHAPGQPVGITVLAGQNDGLRIEVRNRFALTGSTIPGAGTGLIGLAERASLAGGWLEHGHDGDGRFRLVAWLPWQP